MLQAKSFKVEEGDKISEFLRTNRLAPGVSIMVSNGSLIIPFEDGAEPTKEQNILRLKEERLSMLMALDPIIHSQLVLDIEFAELDKQIKELEDKFTAPAETKGKKRDYDSSKENREEVKRLKEIKRQKKNQYMLNEAEVTLKLNNIKVYDQRIKALVEGESK